MEEIMRRKMISGKAELIRQALREYVLHHGTSAPELMIPEAALTLREGRAEDRRERRN